MAFFTKSQGQMTFPKNFFWGAATSSYQVEGNNTNCDWWQWEERSALKEKCGISCRHYELFREDFDLAKSLNHNAHRFSVEWSRIEPKEGEFSTREINHYKEVVVALRERNLEPIITLHHFTNPIWFVKLGGWHNKDAHRYFLRYTEKIVEALSDKVRFWVTINEPLVYVYHCYILGVWPPQEKSLPRAKKVVDNFILAHLRAYQLIHRIYKNKNLPSPFVSIAKNLRAFEYEFNTLKNRLAVLLRNKLFNFRLIDILVHKRSLDFIGINYYTRDVLDVKGWSLRHLFLDTVQESGSSLLKNSLGWDIYPQGLFNLLLRLKKYGLPIFILENGICTTNDNQRWDFIYEHLKCVQRAIEAGTEIIGYLYWSLLDNYEWDKGFAPRFGIIDVDYATSMRTVRESAKKFAQVCKDNRLL